MNKPREEKKEKPSELLNRYEFNHNEYRVSQNGGDVLLYRIGKILDEFDSRISKLESEPK